MKVMQDMYRVMHGGDAQDMYRGVHERDAGRVQRSAL